MISSRSYIIKAVYQWVLDNHLTPYILVNAALEGVEVPVEYVKEGRIVLNLAPEAINELCVEQEYIEFNARFSGISQAIYVPIQGVLAIYAKENTKGIFFERDGDIEPPPEHPKKRGHESEKDADAQTKDKNKEKTEKPSFLKIVK